MCLACRMKVKATHEGAPSFYHIPCGSCKECNEVYQKQWAFRLRFELESLSLRHWNCGFCTLTYNDNYLPHYPLSVFNDIAQYKEIQCFSREDCEKFIRALRSWLWRKYKLSGVDACRYMLCSEYGSTTKRSHYHFLIACPPQVDMREVYLKIVDLWNVNGFIFPRYYLGGVDKYGHNHLPFVVESCAKAAKYVSKYVTKDMYYKDYLERNGLDESSFKRDMRLYKRCRQFHLQSRSLGRSMLDNLSDVQKMDLIKNGYQFIGDDKLYTIPVYIKNKLIFDNVYQYEYTKPSCGQSGEDDICFYEEKRLCRKYANAFFIEHYDEIFNLKVKKYAAFFSQMSDISECRKRGLSDELAITSHDCFASVRSRFGLSVEGFAELYLAFYGLPHDKWVHYFPSLVWLNHYENVDSYFTDLPFVEYDPLMVDSVCSCASVLFSNWYQIRAEYTEADIRKDKLRDFFASMEY